MIGGLIAAALAYWFYRSAEARGLPNFQWGFAGFLSFYVPNFAWALIVAKPWAGSLHASNSAGLAGMVNFSSVIIGIACALAVRQFFLMKAEPARHTSTAS